MTPFGQSHSTGGSQDSTSASSGLVAFKVLSETHKKANFTSQTQDTRLFTGTQRSRNTERYLYLLHVIQLFHFL